MAPPSTRDELHTPGFSASEVMGQAGSENFPVASRLLPRSVRPHLLAIYGFARLVDDIGDESPGDRLAELDWAEAELDRAVFGRAEHPIFVALATTIRARDLPLAPFRELIEANRLDQTVTRYRTFDDLVGYCMLSAAPVGRLVLAVIGASTPERLRRSDRVCVGLQLVEHLQDVAEDFSAGRIYLPLEDLQRFDCAPDRLLDADQRVGLRAVVATEVARARELLADGPALAGSLEWRYRMAVAAFGAGGEAALDAVARADFDVVEHRCRPRPLHFGARWLVAMARAARGVP